MNAKKAVLIAVVIVAAWAVLHGRGPNQPSRKLEASQLVQTISRGQSVRIEDSLVPGSWTIVEFGADW